MASTDLDLGDSINLLLSRLNTLREMLRNGKHLADRSTISTAIDTLVTAINTALAS